jgi:hypothetical protein
LSALLKTGKKESKPFWFALFFTVCLSADTQYILFFNTLSLFSVPFSVIIQYKASSQNSAFLGSNFRHFTKQALFAKLSCISPKITVVCEPFTKHFSNPIVCEKYFLVGVYYDLFNIAQNLLSRPC